jgi:hypothetical protein
VNAKSPLDLPYLKLRWFFEAVAVCLILMELVLNPEYFSAFGMSI